MKALITLMGLWIGLVSAASAALAGDGPPSLVAGQSATQLPDGRWLLLGGEAAGGPLATAVIWDPEARTATSVAAQLVRPRAWHSATVLADGTVLVWGGLDRNDQVIDRGEVFDPGLQTFQTIDGLPLTPRARHTATLITDGQLLIAGGVSSDGTLLDTADLWDSKIRTARPVPVPLTTPRRDHAATLVADGTVLLWGGLDRQGRPSSDGDLFVPELDAFTPVAAATAPPSNAAPHVVASLPVDGATGVTVDSRIGLRFSRELSMPTVNVATVLLIGPEGFVPARITAAERGMLAFIAPGASLRPATTYRVVIDGPLDETGLAVPFTEIEFTTAAPAGAAAPGQSTAAAKTESAGWAQDARGDQSVSSPEGAGSEGFEFLPLPQAPRGVTALSGRVLTVRGLPLANVTARIGGQTTRTDVTGRFLLTGPASGWQELVVDGHTARMGRATYGVFVIGVEIEADVTTALPFTVWMPEIDAVHMVRIPSPTTGDVVLTTPQIPGLEVHIPAGTTIRDVDGHVVTEVGITPVSIPRPPFPLPRNVEVPVYFTVQPGGAYLEGSGRARIVYPNYARHPSGTRFDFWRYRPDETGWYVYGFGSVNEAGDQVVPDPGVGIYRFTGAMIVPPSGAAPTGPKPGTNVPPAIPPTDGEPVDLGTGLFVMNKTDLFVADVLPIALTRTYRPNDTRQRAFGIGTMHNYDIFLVGDNNPWTFIQLILPDGGRLHFARVSSGVGFSDAVYEHTSSPTAFYKSRIVWNGHGWDLTLKNGTLYVFPDGFGLTEPTQGALVGVRDRNGNSLTLDRDLAVGTLRKITSPSANGRWVELTYDAAHRVIQARDNIGRTVSYAYDAGGRLATVVDAAGGTTTYTYDALHRMLTIRDPRGIVYLTNAYDAAGRVVQQTLGDGGVYQFAYTISGGAVTRTDVTDPRGAVRRVTFDAAGYSLTDTAAFGTPIQQATTYTRDASAGRILTVTDALARQTTFTYDAMGNVISITRLPGTPDAQQTSFTYEPTFNQVASITDPLLHTTTFTYDAQGNLVTATNALGQSIAQTFNAVGQPLSLRDPLGNTTQFRYAVSDLQEITDSLGNVTARVTDAVGRMLKTTNPVGRSTAFAYDALNRLTAATDPRGGATGFAYDGNSNLTQVTDALGHITRYTPYDAMDRPGGRIDPLNRSESYAYDVRGNLITFTDRRAKATAFTYDLLGRRTKATYADASTTTYAYDAGNRLTQIVDSLAGTITRTYDVLNRLTQETTPQGTVSYAYDKANRRTSMSVAGQPLVTYAYDNANRLTGVTQGAATVTMTYDAAGRRTGLTLPNGVVTAYSYDAASRLTGIVFTRGGTTLGDLAYTYDRAGNRTGVGGTWARTGLPQAIASATYDAANQQLGFGTATMTYDQNGNLASLADPGGTTLFDWSARNQLVSLAGPGLTASFAYEGMGRRTTRIVNGTRTDFVYDRLNPVQEKSGALVRANILGSLGVDEYFARTDASGTRVLLTEALGSTLALTDSAGLVKTEYTYEPFGQTAFTGGADENAFQFTGRENDRTGLYYYRARYYDQARQRFLSQDPLDLRSSERNAYTYVGNEPTRFVDPLGLDKHPGPGDGPGRPTPPVPPAFPKPPDPWFPPDFWDSFGDRFRRNFENDFDIFNNRVFDKYGDLYRPGLEGLIESLLIAESMGRLPGWFTKPLSIFIERTIEGIIAGGFAAGAALGQTWTGQRPIPGHLIQP